MRAPEAGQGGLSHARPGLSCFRDYDIRGRVGVDLDEAVLYRIGRSFAQVMRPGTTVSGRDNRPSSAALQAALIEGVLDGGSDVIDIGLCGTEEVYFATSRFAAGGGLMVTASHNPIDENGLKLVRAGSRPVLRESGLREIHDTAAGAAFVAAARGALRREEPRNAYAAKVVSFVDPARMRPLKILVNAGNGAAGAAFDAIAARLEAAQAPLTFVRIHHDPDGSFPNGIPNPLLPENRSATALAVRACGADFGVAWDGDFDRCFLFDDTGAFVDGEHVVALLAAAFLVREPGARIVHDPRVIWNILDTVARGGGTAVVSRTGHALIKARMRESDAVYGGEMSAHHYFRDFMYCDSGMIPWLLVADLVGQAGQCLSRMVAGMRDAFPTSGEINFRLDAPVAAMDRVERAYVGTATVIDRLDGLSLTFDRWRFNLRRSSTEPILRLNVESRGDRGLLNARLAEIRAVIAGTGQSRQAGSGPVPRAFSPLDRPAPSRNHGP